MVPSEREFSPSRLGSYGAVFRWWVFMSLVWSCGGAEMPRSPAELSLAESVPAELSLAESVPAEASLAKSPVRHVVVISVDGLNSEHLLAALDRGSLPTLARLRREGSATVNARTDYDVTLTLPNHITMLSGRPVLGRPGLPHAAYHGYVLNVVPSVGDTIHRHAGGAEGYVTTMFDVAHDLGLSTGIFASKPKFSLFWASLNEGNGGLDTTGRDQGRNKLDHFVVDEDTAALVAGFCERMRSSAIALSFVHLRDPDMAGHLAGWGRDMYAAALEHSDVLLAEILACVEATPRLAGSTAIIVTSDHGGVKYSHHEPHLPANYTVPLFVWGPQVPAGLDLYRASSGHYADPGGRRPSYADVPQPIRNGDAANLALRMLGLPPIEDVMMSGDLLAGYLPR
ncbi:MAG: alkaline phosphatase family protein [Nannocystaceae bacterium]